MSRNLLIAGGSLSAIIAVAVIWAEPSSTSIDPDARSAVETSGLKVVTPETQDAIDRGLSWLATRQHANGGFGSGMMYQDNVAVTGLCGMAFLAAGNTPGRGRYGGNVERAVEYLVGQAKSNGYIINDRNRYHGPMYGHGFATLFLAEVYGMSPNEELRDTLQKAVKLIVDSQNDEGGWRYFPDSREADISVSVCQMMALRAARNAGLHVPKSTVDRCMEYIKRCQNPIDGGFRYRLQGRPNSEFPRSAAAVVAFYNAGIYEGPALQRGLNYLMRYLPSGQIFRYESYYFYAHYYAVQAMWHAGGDYWKKWYPAIRDELLQRQNGGDDHWRSSSICNEYGTAMALLILQLPNNYLPIFQR